MLLAAACFFSGLSIHPDAVITVARKNVAQMMLVIFFCCVIYPIVTSIALRVYSGPENLRLGLAVLAASPAGERDDGC